MMSVAEEIYMTGSMSEQSATNSTSETPHAQGFQMIQGHVNSIKSILGFDKPDSLFGRFAAHTKRKLAELEAAKAANGGVGGAHASHWAASMKPESDAKDFIKASKTQFMISVGIFSLMAFWLLVIRTVHHKDDPMNISTNEHAQQQLALGAIPPTAVIPAAQPVSVAPPLSGIPANFGAPSASFGSPSLTGFSQAAAAPVPTPPVATAQAIATQSSASPVYSSRQGIEGYTPGMQPTYQPAQPTFPQSQVPPQMFSEYPSMYSAPSPGYGLRVPASNFQLQPQQPAGVYAARPHAAARHQVVANR
jgi:hypothetical protein